MKKIYTDEYGDICFSDEYALEIAQRVLKSSPQKSIERILEEDGFSPKNAEHIFENQLFNNTVGICGKCNLFFENDTLHGDVISDGHVCDDCEYDYYCDEQPEALYVIGQEWLEGKEGRQKSESMALKYFEAGADQNKCHNIKGDCAREAGILNKKSKNLINARHYFLKGAREEGDARSSYELYKLRKTLRVRGPKKLLKYAAKHNIPGAMYDLSFSVKSEKRKMKLLEEAAELGYAKAHYHLALISLKHNPKRARDQLYWASCERHTPSRFLLAFLNQEGVGGEKNPVAAEEWFNLAIKKRKKS